MGDRPQGSLQRTPRARHRRVGPYFSGASQRLARAAGNAVFLLLGLAVIGLLASVILVVARTASALGTGAEGTVATPAPSTGDEWIPLRSQSPADILAAARSGALLRESRDGSGDHVDDLSRLGPPVLVVALRPAGVSAAQVPDFYVIPVLSQASAATDAIELALNPAHTAVQEIAIVTYATPRANGSIAMLGADHALQAVASQRQVAAAAMSRPYLVYFPMDPQWQTSQSGQPTWTAGGALPADPIWLVPTTRGGPYLAGNDCKVYTTSQLPLWSGHS